MTAAHVSESEARRRAGPEVDAELARGHGLSDAEWQRILKLLARTPTWTELGIFSAMFSEHCSYKSSRYHLRRLPTEGPQVVLGPGENAGAVDIGQGLCAVFKMESHNHPSFIEPFQGAATGVGGILRDVFTMGARPVAAMNSLRFGAPEHWKTAHLVEGVVQGIGHYGNCFGVPTVGGEVAFDARYNGNILVNAFALGIAEQDRIFLGTAAGAGNPIMYVGAKTGRDGIHGATMASEEFSEEVESKLPTVQVGDPFTEKLLLEACLEAMKTDVIVGIQDMGAAGLTSSAVEMAGRGGSGIELWLEKLPTREPGMTPYEMMLSESQERMLVVAKAGREDVLREIYSKWDLDAVQIGVVTDSARVVVKMDGATYADLPVEPIADAPVYTPEDGRPMSPDVPGAVREAWTFSAPPDFRSQREAEDALRSLLSDPSLASKRWVYRQYDHMVRVGTTLRPGDAEAAVLRVLKLDGSGETGLAIAMAIDCNAWACALDPRRGMAASVAEAARNVSCVGAVPLAITDCLNFASPERPEIMWEFSEAIDGMAEACRELNSPVVSGNVSFYNETDGRPILPTPTVALVGVMPATTPRVWSAHREGGLELLLLGPPPHQDDGEEALGGSAYLRQRLGRLAGRPASVSWKDERGVQAVVRGLIRGGKLHAVHDVSDGGLGFALAEMCVSGPTPTGMTVSLPGAGGGGRTDARLFGERPSQVIVCCTAEHKDAVFEAAAGAGVDVTSLGETGGAFLAIAGVLKVPVDELRNIYDSSFEDAVFGKEAKQ